MGGGSGSQASAGARRSSPKGFELRRLRCYPNADDGSAPPSPPPLKRRKKQRHSRGEMRSEHNRGASLAAFLLAVSTITLLFVSPVEGQGPPCTTDADCPAGEPFCSYLGCFIIRLCETRAFPGKTGSCPATDESGQSLVCHAGTCETCAVKLRNSSSLDDCQTEYAHFPDTTRADEIANCQRSCFDYYACETNADCQDAPSPLALCTNGQCGECEVSALPGAAGSCPDIPVGQTGEGPQLCSRTATTARNNITPICETCAEAEARGVTTLAECVILENPPANQTADVVANCQRGCFDFYACATNADCPADRPLCESGQCLGSSVPSSPTFSPLDGMGCGSSA